jgi:hypothetical protein
MQMHGRAKKPLKSKRELGTRSINLIIFVKAYLATVLPKTDCVPNFPIFHMKQIKPTLKENIGNINHFFNN